MEGIEPSLITGLASQGTTTIPHPHRMIIIHTEHKIKMFVKDFKSLPINFYFVFLDSLILKIH